MQISLLSRKYGFLTRHHPRLRTFLQSLSQSCFLGGSRPGFRLRRPAAGVRSSECCPHTTRSHLAPPCGFYTASDSLSCLHLLTEAACTRTRKGEAAVALCGREGVVCFARAGSSWKQHCPWRDCLLCRIKRLPVYI